MTLTKNLFFQCILFVCLVCSCTQKAAEFESENEEYDEPDQAAQFEFNRTKDPATGTVPAERLLKAMI